MLSSSGQYTFSPAKIDQSWRKYQNKLNKKNKSSQNFKRFVTAFLVLMILFSIYRSFGYIADKFFDSDRPRKKPELAKEAQSKPKYLLNKSDIRNILSGISFTNLCEKKFRVFTENGLMEVTTSIDIPLQEYIARQISKVNKLKRGKPSQIGIVVIEPVSGEVRAMGGFDITAPDSNPCISSQFPAASIFKIVTAAAAVEKLGLTSQSKLFFNGSKYTLYKSQLRNRKNKYTNKISLSDSFAQSVNPVFGKIGANRLGKETLESYAMNFGFNQLINFEIPLSQSSLTISDKKYNWAEIACGFNRETAISPLHGALISAAVVNNGVIPEPTIIDELKNQKGLVIYKPESYEISRAYSADSAVTMKTLMKRTIRSGTARKAFRNYKNDKVLSRLSLGGKTGSIYNKAHNIRYDWFVGYAEEKAGKEKLAVAVMVGHEKYIGKRSAQFAREIIKKYYRDLEKKA